MRTNVRSAVLSLLSVSFVTACGLDELDLAPPPDEAPALADEVDEHDALDELDEDVGELDDELVELDALFLDDTDVPDVSDEETEQGTDDEEGETELMFAARGGCVEYTTRHLQASMQRTDSVAQRRQAIDRAFVNPDGVSPDTISWTEIETQAQIDRINGKAGWDTYWPHQPNNPVVNPRNAVPISWKKSVYKFLSGKSHKSSDGRAGVSPHRYVTRVRLLHIPSGTKVVRVAHHSVSGIDSPNKGNRAYRIATHAKNMKTFNDVMMAAAFPVIGSGDFNTVHLRKKLRAENNGVQRYVYDVPDRGGSHGKRLIDYVVHRKSDGDVYRLKDVRFINLAPSDHKGVRARFTYRPPPCR